MKNKLLFTTLFLLLCFNSMYSQDTDGDGILDSADLDSDNDGVLDVYEQDPQFVTTVDAFWTFENSLNDVSGNNNNPNGTGPLPTFSTDAIEGCYSAKFNGSQRIGYGVNNGFMTQPTSQISFSAWIKPDNVTGRRIIYEEGGSGRGAALWLNEGKLTFSTRGGAQVNAISSAPPLEVNKWYHVAGTFNSGTLTVYLDGVPNSISAGYTSILTHTDSNKDGISGLGGRFFTTAINQSGFDELNFSGLMDAVRYRTINTVWPSTEIDSESTLLDIDSDGDGIVDRLDLDNDNDGVPDILETGGPDTNNDGRVDSFVDNNGNGLADVFDPSAGGTSLLDIDTDGDCVRNRLDLDSDNDGIADIVEAGGVDINNDGVVDGTFTDGDNDGWSNVFDSNNGGTALTDADTDSNGDPDRIDLDSDGDGCSDANEYYGFSNADGGDGGEYGAGTPQVDTNGLVIAAGYDGTNFSDVIDPNINSGCDPYIFEITGDWQTATNWNLNKVPTALDNAIIRSNATVTATQEIGNLVIDPTFKVDINSGQTLNINGNVVNNGDFIGGGEVILNGTSAQVISGGGSFENLRIDNATAVGINDPTDLSGILYVDQGTLNTNNNLTLKCSFPVTQFAQIGEVVGTIVGNLTTEQCFPARRAFRLVSSSVTTSGTINANWQEGLNNTGTNFPADNKPGTSGLGTHITGSQTGANGFDATPSGNPSLFTFSNDNSQQWNAVANTNSALAAGDAYRLMIRGDRSINVTSNSATPTDTKLRSTGTVAVGPIPFNTTISGSIPSGGGKFVMLGNPFHSIVDMYEVLTPRNTSDFRKFFWIWDPTLGGTPTVGSSGGRGGYVTVNPDPVNGASTIDEPGVSGSTQMGRFLQPYQAFFIQGKGGITNPSLTFKEADKAVTQPQVSVFSTTPASYIRMTLFDKISYDNNSTPDDGLVIFFSPNSSNAKDINDAPKFPNLDENLARDENGDLISYEERAMPQSGEILKLFTSQYRSTDYVLKVEVGSFPSTKVYLVDNYNDTETLLENDAINTYTFSIESSIAESVATDRFEIKFDNVTLGIDDFENSQNISSLHRKGWKIAINNVMKLYIYSFI